MASNAKSYNEGDVYKVFNKRGDKLLITVTIPETMCRASLDRFLFFKHNIAPGDYTLKKVRSGD